VKREARGVFRFTSDASRFTMSPFITIKGARTHNLKNINVSIPRNKLTVITGLSGSGKSSLAFDTIYAEGQRRYVESLSAYARQFLDRVDKPDVDVIEGLSPAVSVEQKTASHNPRSTVGTVTEIHDHLRLLFARIGKPFCYKCGRPIEKQTIADIVARLLKDHASDNIMVLAPIAEQRKGEHAKVFERLRAQGFVRVLVDEKIFDLSEEIFIDAKKKHSILVVIDRVKISVESRPRLSESLETALKIGNQVARIDFLSTTHKKISSEVVNTNNSCIRCGISYPKIEPQMFSFNSPIGACPQCDGLGELMYVDENLVVPSVQLSINQGAIVPWFGKKTNYYQALLEAAAKTFHFSLDAPFKKLSTETKKILFDGSTERLKIHTGRYS
jgi:excinuclease ABC subunit A